MTALDTSADGEVAAGTKRRPEKKRKRRAAYWIYLIPGMVGLSVVILAPFIMNLIYSMTKWKGGFSKQTFIGFDNYINLMSDDSFWLSFKNSIFMIAAMVIVPTLIGLLLAAVLFDYIGRHFNSKTAAFLRVSYYLPQILPVSVAGILWNWVLNAENGALNQILSALGVANPPNWLGSTDTALPSIMFVLIWIQIGYPTIIFMSALERVDPELYEAAEIDGAGWWQRFRAITIPQIKPETFVIVLTCTVAALKVFAPIYVLTRGGPESSTLVPSYYSYLNFFDKSKVGYGAAIATVLTLVILIVAIVIQVLQNRSARREAEGK